MDITMSRVCLASDTCDIYFTYIKVNHLLYTCSLDPFEDGVLLDSPLVCMHRYCRNTMDNEEECKHQGTTTPSAREAWKRRRKKTETTSWTWTSGPWTCHQQQGAIGQVYRAQTSGNQPGHLARPEPPDIRPPARKSGPRHSREQQGWTLPARTSGPSARTSAPPTCVQRVWAVAHVPLRPLDYIYSPSTYVLGLVLC